MVRGWIALLLPAVVACTGQHVVAGEERTEAEQLAAILPGWCSDICQRLGRCEQPECVCTGDVCECAGVDEDCPAECREDMSRWTQGSDECAAVGQRFKECIETAGCSLFGANGALCETSDAEEDACPRPGTPDGGSGSSGPSGGPNGGGSGPAVVCDASSSSGPSREPGTTQVLCELEHADCSDGQERRVVCVSTSQGPVSCACHLDEVLTGAFDPGGTCPTIAQQNVGCGWSLLEM